MVPQRPQIAGLHSDRSPWLNRTGRIVRFAGLALTWGIASAGAITNSWTKATSDNWQTTNSWSLNILPDSSQSVMIVNPGFKAVAINFETTTTNFRSSLTVNDLTISGSGLNTLLLNFAGTDFPLRVLNGLAVGTGGRLLNFSSGLSVDAGSFVVTNADVIQDGGQVQATNSTTILSVDGNGTYQLTNGVFAGSQVQLGVQSTGTFNQYGGLARMASLNVGGSAPGNGSGVYNLYGGELGVSGILNVGAFFGSANFFHQGGTNRVGQLSVIPYFAGAPAVYTFNGGLLTAGGVSVIARDQTSSRFEQNGGVVIITNGLGMGGLSSQKGSYLLRDGALTTRSIFLDGFLGPSVFVQTNGTTHVAEEIRLSGSISFFVGTLVLHGGTLTCLNVLSGGGGVNITQTGGAFTVTNLLSYSGFAQQTFARYTFAGGTLTASNIDLAAELIIGSSAQTGRITNAGYFKMSGRLRVGDANELLGRFILTNNATINLGDGIARLSFANSSAEAWNGAAILVVTNWNGSPAGGGADQLKFGSSPAGLTPAQLGQIRFANPSGFAPGAYLAQILATGEVVPAPRPSILFTRQGKNVVLNWTGNFSLQTATNVTGPYVDVPGVTPPYTNDSTLGSQRFYRLRY